MEILQTTFQESHKKLQINLNTLKENMKKQSEDNTIQILKSVLVCLHQKKQSQLLDQVDAYGDLELVSFAKDILNAMNSLNSVNPSNLSKNSSNVKVQTQKAKPKQSSPAKPKKLQRSDSLLKRVIGKFVKQDENVREMILPQKQPQVIYDPIKKKYVIDGETEQEKQKSKPPPRKNIGTNNKAKQKQKSQMQLLMAPPTFKRKGVAKKKAEQSTSSDIMNSSIITFEQFENFLTYQLQNVEKKISQLFHTKARQSSQLYQMESSISGISQDFIQNIESKIKQFEDTTQEIIDLKDELNLKYISAESKFSTEGRHLKIVSQLSKLNSLNIQLMRINKKVPENVDASISSKKIREEYEKYIQIEREQFESEKKLMSDNFEDQINQLTSLLTNQKYQSQKMSQQLALIQEKYKSLEQKLSSSERQWFESEQKAKEKESDRIFELENQVSQKESQLSILEHQLTKYKEENKKYIAQFGEFQNKINKFQHESQQWNNIKDEIAHSNLLEQFNDTLIAETRLLHAIQQKRISINTQDQYLQPCPEPLTLQKGQGQPVHEESDSFLCLSATMSSIIESLTEKLQLSLQRSGNLQQKYNFLVSQLQTNRSSHRKQMEFLQRSVYRLKSLNQNYQQTQEQLELQNHKLEEQLQNVKSKHKILSKEYEKNRQMLEQSIREINESKNNSRVLIQNVEKDLDEAIEKQKNTERQNQLLQEEVSQVTQQYNRLIQENKSLRKTIKQNLRISDQKADQQEQQIDKKRLQIQKLQNQLSKKEQHIEKIVTQHKNQKKQLQKLNYDYTQLQQKLSNEKQAHLLELRKYEDEGTRFRTQNQEILMMLEEANQQNQQYLTKITELQNEAITRNKQIKNINYQFELKQLEIERLQCRETEIIQLRQQVQNLQSKIKKQEELSQIKEDYKTLKFKISEYEALILEHQNSIIQSASQIQWLQRELQQSEASVSNKIVNMAQAVSDSQSQQTDLINQIKDYEQLITNLSTQLEMAKNKDDNSELKVVYEQKFFLQQQKLQQNRIQIGNLHEQINNMKTELKDNEQFMKQNDQNLAILTQELQDNQTAICLLKNQIEVKKNQLSKLEIQMAQRQKQTYQKLSSYQTQILNLIAQKDLKIQKLSLLEKYSAENTDLEKQNADLKIIIENKDKILDQQRNQHEKAIHDFQKIILKMQEEIDSKEIKKQQNGQAKINEQNEPVDKIRDSEKRLIQQNSELKVLISEKQMLVAKLNGQIGQYQASEHAIAEDLRVKDQKMNQLKKEVIILKIILKSADQKYRQLTQKLDQKTPIQNQKIASNLNQQPSLEINQLHELVLSQQSALESLSKDVQQKDKQIQALKKKISQLQESEQLATRKCKQAEKNMDKYEEQFRAYKKLESEYKKLETHSRKLQGEIQDLEKTNRQLMEIREQLTNKLYSSPTIEKTQNKENTEKKTPEKIEMAPPSKKVPPENNVSKDQQTNKEQIGGFLGSLSSFFLTSRESQKLSKI